MALSRSLKYLLFSLILVFFLGCSGNTSSGDTPLPGEEEKMQEAETGHQKSTAGSGPSGSSSDRPPAPKLPLIIYIGYVLLLLMLIATIAMFLKANENRKRDLETIGRRIDELEETLRPEKEKLRFNSSTSVSKKDLKELDTRCRQVEKRVSHVEDLTQSIRSDVNSAPLADGGASQSPTENRSSGHNQHGDRYRHQRGDDRVPSSTSQDGGQSPPDENLRSQKTEPGRDRRGPTDGGSWEEERLQNEDQLRQQQMKSGLVDDYNKVLNDDLTEKRFRQKYTPVNLTTHNQEQRSTRTDVPVVLKTENRGTYIGVEAQETFYVFPDPERSVDDVARREGGYDDVFQCDNVGHGRVYLVKRLDEPAVFHQDRDGLYHMERSGSIALHLYS